MIYRNIVCVAVVMLALLQGSAQAQTPATAQPAASVSDAGNYGIAAKRPVFAGACKGCPWGILALVTSAALKPYGYDVQVCWICSNTYGPRLVADKTKPVPRETPSDPETAALYGPLPNAAPDFGATNERNLVDGWQGTGDFAKDNKKRQNYRVIAALQQPNYLIAAATKRSGITSLAQIATRSQPTWIVIDNNQSARVLAYYGITEEGLKAKRGGILTTASREMRASADVFIANGLLANTPEQRVWYEVSQLNDLVYLDFDEALLAKLAQEPGFVRATMPMTILRGVDRPIPTVMRATHYIYTRDDVPNDFAYAVAKALDEHQELFRMQAEPWYYDPKLVAVSKLIPMHPGALKYYRERGYLSGPR